MCEGIHATAFERFKQQNIDYIEDSIKDDIAEGEEDIECINEKRLTIKKVRASETFEDLFDIMIDRAWEVNGIKKEQLQAYGIEAIYTNGTYRYTIT